MGINRRSIVLSERNSPVIFLRYFLHMQAKRNGTQRQTALVTGGSGGIGLELAKNLARAGFDLVSSRGSVTLWRLLLVNWKGSSASRRTSSPPICGSRTRRR